MSQAIVPPSAVPFGAPALTAGGINGLGSLRFVGTINGGPPTTGTYQTGDVVLDLNNLVVWVCQSGGTPGTWVRMSYLRTDANAPNPQTVANPIDLASGTTVYGSGSTDFYVQSSGGTNSWSRIHVKTASADWYIGTSNNYNGNQLYIEQGGTSYLLINENGVIQSAGGGGVYNLVESLSGGYKVQSGQYSYPNQTYSSSTFYKQSITFPTAFTTTPIVVGAMNNGNTGGGTTTGYCDISFENISTTGFTIVLAYGVQYTGQPVFSWIAIGS
ncbi:H-type lectin domain-containing protein [Alicyclobacillus sendaiensis]|uniref:H-type lectin domain-containing protein n=1 Tax=Alicyclobacillus sendaiensis TaxID=192387 RepID=UPI0009FB89B0|nr:H-type lectin domain-containing protein [Alicyclobacillus sendaiensis]